MTYIHRSSSVDFNSESKDSGYARSYRDGLIKDYHKRYSEWQKEKLKLNKENAKNLKDWEIKIKKINQEYETEIGIWKERSFWHKLFYFFKKPTKELLKKPKLHEIPEEPKRPF